MCFFSSGNFWCMEKNRYRNYVIYVDGFCGSERGKSIKFSYIPKVFSLSANRNRRAENKRVSPDEDVNNDDWRSNIICPKPIN